MKFYKICSVLIAFILTNVTLMSDMEHSKLELHKFNVYSYIKEIGIQAPDVVFAQAVLESGNFNSRVCKKNNNLFGMRLARSRQTVAIGKRSGYATYTHWTKSVEDYKLWQNVRPLKIKDTRDYYSYLKSRKYFTDKNYVKHLKSIHRKNSDLYSEI